MYHQRFVLLFLLCCIAVLRLSAQTPSLTGRVTDSETNEALTRATVQLYRLGRDTTFVAGTYSDAQGAFQFNTNRTGQYLLRISFLGYKSTEQRVALTAGHTQAFGKIALKPDATMLDEAVVTANLPKMIIKDDTVVYNADAYRVPEGSVIEALVEALPGAKIDDDGKVSINGKNVKRFKMDGRDFMTGNNDAVMKNLPSYVVDQVKAYDEKSDLSRLTGIDDGNDDFVLEFVTKRSVRKGLQANPDVGIGTDGRYGIRLTAMKPFGDVRYTFMGNANNVNDRNFSGRGGRGRGNNQGQRETKTGALDVSYEKQNKLRVSGRVTWNHGDTDNWNRTGSESFVNTNGGAFSNSINQSYQRNNSWTGNMNLQWTINPMTTLSFRPDVSFSTNDNRSFSTSASFNANPYDYVTDPLSAEGLRVLNSLSQVVNSRLNKSLGYGENKNINTQVQLYRRLGTSGRNMALSASFSYRDGNNQNASLSAVHLYQKKNHLGEDSTYQTNRYTVSTDDNLSYSLGITYTEPLWKPRTQTPPTPQRGDERGERSEASSRFPHLGGQRGGQPRGFGQQGLFLQLNYRYSYNYQKSDPATYDFPDYSAEEFAEVLQEYRDWTALFGYLDNPYESYLSPRLSRYSERTEYNHTAEVQLRYVRNKMNMNVGVSVLPQRSHFIQQYLGHPIDTVRTVTNLSPTLNLRYRFNQQTNLQVQFRGQTQQPNITQLLEVYDDTNPLNITMGNPGLEPAFNSNLNANFQMMRQPKIVTDSLGFQVPKNQRNWSFNANAGLQITSNSIGNVVTYNETTGGRITRPENINGNWNTNFGMSFTVGLDTLNRWDITGSVNASYSHRVGYVNLNRTAEPDRNVTHTYNVNPSVSLSYRNKWLSVSLNGRTTYAHTENRLQASNNLTTWNFQYGGNTKITFPWGSNLSTDFHMYSKRGYADETLNTNELLWNAQLSHSFLRSKALTVMLQWYDILRQQTNFSRTVNANGWRDQEVNTITSYAMLHVSYRLNLFGAGNDGGRGEGRRGRRGGWGDGPRDWGNGPGGFGGGPGGGFGGGRRNF